MYKENTFVNQTELGVFDLQPMLESSICPGSIFQDYTGSFIILMANITEKFEVNFWGIINVSRCEKRFRFTKNMRLESLYSFCHGVTLFSHIELSQLLKTNLHVQKPSDQNGSCNTT